MRERYTNFVETINKILEEKNSFGAEDKIIWKEMKSSYVFIQNELDDVIGDGKDVSDIDFERSTASLSIKEN